MPIRHRRDNAPKWRQHCNAGRIRTPDPGRADLPRRRRLQGMSGWGQGMADSGHEAAGHGGWGRAAAPAVVGVHMPVTSPTGVPTPQNTRSEHPRSIVPQGLERNGGRGGIRTHGTLRYTRSPGAKTTPGSVPVPAKPCAPPPERVFSRLPGRRSYARRGGALATVGCPGRVVRERTHGSSPTKPPSRSAHSPGYPSVGNGALRWGSLKIGEHLLAEAPG